MQDSFGARHFAPHPESLNKLEIDSTEGEGRSPWRVTLTPSLSLEGRGRAVAPPLRGEGITVLPR